MDKKQMAALVQKAKQGDEAAFAELYTECAGTVTVAAQKIVRDEQVAQDITQDTFLAAFEKIKTLEKDAAFGGWVVQIAVNLAKMHCRKNKEVLAPTDETIDTVDDALLPDDIADKKDGAKIINGIIDTLPQAQREAVVMFYLANMPIKKIAADSGASPASIKMLLSRARTTIKTTVKAIEKAQGINLHSVTIGAALAAEAAGVAAPAFVAGGAASAGAAGAAGSTAGTAGAGVGAGAVAGAVAGTVAVVGGGVLAATVLLASPEVVLDTLTITPPQTVAVGQSITLDYTASITVDGETYTLDYTGGTITPSGEIEEKAMEQIDAFSAEWNSENPSVATVQGGKVTAVSNGEATITLTVTHGETSQQASTKIKVVTPVSGLTMAETITVLRGETAGLGASIQPATASNNGITYESADPAIASVDASGTVTGNAPGQVEIKATSAENPAIYALCMVTVDVEPESITLSQEQASLTVGRGFTLTATVNPEDVTIEYSLAWASSNPAIATVDANGTVKAIAPGTATITCNMPEFEGIEAACTVTVKSAAVQAPPSTPSAPGTPAAPGEAPPAPQGGDVAAAIAAGYAHAASIGMATGGGGSHNAPISTKISTEAMIAGIISEINFWFGLDSMYTVNIYESGGYIYVTVG